MRFWNTVDSIIIVALVGHIHSAAAYEADLHYGATYWLARQAGFSKAESHEMARGNQRADDGYLDAKSVIAGGVCLFKSQTASELVRRVHFRSQEPVPAPPDKRQVWSKDPYASKEVRGNIKSSGSSRMDLLYEFGLALHGWQDSHSHQGETSTVLGCDDNLVWAHSKKRGGIWGRTAHDADLTYKFPEDCRSTLRTSFEFMLELKERNGGPERSQEWPSLESAATAFCRLPTKTDKAKWLNEKGVPQAEATVKLTNLDDGSTSFAAAPDLYLDSAREDGSLPSPTGPAYATASQKGSLGRAVDLAVQDVFRTMGPQSNAEAQRWFGNFFRAWLTSSLAGLPSVAKEYFEFSSRGFADPALVDDLLLRWRLIDRGLALRTVDVRSLTSNPAAFLLASQANWRSLLIPVRQRDEPILVLRPPGAPTSVYVALAIFRTAPYDVLLVTAEQQGASFRITRWGALPFH